MFDPLGTFLTASDWWAYVARIGGFYLLAWLVHRLTRRMAGRLVRLSRFTPRVRRLRPGRQATLQSLIGSAISFVAFATPASETHRSPSG